MPKSIRDIPKKRGRGRPKQAGRGEGILVRLHAQQLAGLDGWLKTQDGKPSRPEGIRRLVEMALGGTGRKAPNKASAAKAENLAANKLDDLADKSLPADAQERAKRRLLEGPKEFRDIRGDRPKKKD
jgi:hypothetical protein